jgi:hypothetical protein
VQAESLPIKQDSSAKDSTGSVKARTSGENAFAGRLARKGRPDRTESRCKWTRLFGEDSHKLDKQSREDDDKRARPNEQGAANAIESAEADRVFH